MHSLLLRFPSGTGMLLRKPEMSYKFSEGNCLVNSHLRIEMANLFCVKQPFRISVVNKLVGFDTSMLLF